MYRGGLIFQGIVALSVLVGFAQGTATHALTVTTTVEISVCGDGISGGKEICDYGAGNNLGGYSTSTANRTCMPNCLSYGPYCGDAILQPTQGEECDDGNNTSGDRCTDFCRVESLPIGGGGGGGYYTPGSPTLPAETRVTIYGKAYPNSNVNILKDGGTLGIVRADAKADFYFTTTSIPPGVTTLGFWAEDETGLKSIAFTTTLTVVANAATTITGIFIPPTISIDKRRVRQGEILNISGQTAPTVKVTTHVNSNEEILKTVVSDTGGKWKVPFDTTPLENEDFHTTKAAFETTLGGNIAKSAFSQSLTFYVGGRDVGARASCDLNGDGRVNLLDFSIMLFYWNTRGPVGDLNNDGRVNLIDFSILLSCWTG